MTYVGLLGSPLDRADALRSNVDELNRLLQAPSSRLLSMQGLEVPVRADGALEWTSTADRPEDTPLAFLGLANGVAHFVALTLVPPEAPRSRAPFGVLDILQPSEAATYAMARSLVDWHSRHGFCPRCGGTTSVFRAGWGRRCDRCKTEHYPRTDPVVIMLAEHEGRVLVGRQPRFPAGRYSALAGFVEVGESLEKAVARELGEEAGVKATSVRYVASQPWPFPSSLMLACIAAVESDAITLDGEELEDAMWVTREEVLSSLHGAANARFVAPPTFAIAHSLLRHWVDVER